MRTLDGEDRGGIKMLKRGWEFALDYLIEGRNSEILHIELDSEADAVIAEVGKMIYMLGDVRWSIAVPGQGVGGKIASAVRRKMAGESILMTHFTGPGRVGLAGELPGTIRAIELQDGKSVVVQRGGFLAAELSVKLGMALVKRLRVGLIGGGQNLILQRLTGPGKAFVHAAGDFTEFNLVAGEQLRADTRCMVWFDETVDYSVKWTGGVRKSLFGGEGLFLSSFTGPGRVTLQTMGHVILDDAK